jgi:hypothetical protein
VESSTFNRGKIRRVTRLKLLAVLLAALSVAAAACSGGGGGDDDDDDDVATSPTPTPEPPSFCYVIWGSTSGGLVTEYYLDFPASAWTSNGGPVTIDDVDNWAELTQRDSAGNLVFQMVATAGTITSVAAPDGLGAGSAVTVDDDTPRLHTDYLRGVTGTAGGGSFTGVWSDPASPRFSLTGKTLGTGTIAVTAVSGTASAPATVGDAYSYAQCYSLGR